jgi:hypothetical protein
MIPPSELRRPRSNAAATLFALYRWKPEQQQIIVGDAGRGARFNLP